MKLQFKKKPLKALSNTLPMLNKQITPNVAGGRNTYLCTYMECFSKFGGVCPTMPKDC